MKLNMPQIGLVIPQSDRSYKNPCGPFDDKVCFVCGRPIGNGSSSVGVRVDNPTLRLCCVGGSVYDMDRPDGAEFNVYIGLSCLRRVMEGAL